MSDLKFDSSKLRSHVQRNSQTSCISWRRRYTGYSLLGWCERIGWYDDAVALGAVNALMWLTLTVGKCEVFRFFCTGVYFCHVNYAQGYITGSYVTGVVYATGEGYSLHCLEFLFFKHLNAHHHKAPCDRFGRKGEGASARNYHWSSTCSVHFILRWSRYFPNDWLSAINMVQFHSGLHDVSTVLGSCTTADTPNEWLCRSPSSTEMDTKNGNAIPNGTESADWSKAGKGSTSLDLICSWRNSIRAMWCISASLLASATLPQMTMKRANAAVRGMIVRKWTWIDLG